MKLIASEFPKKPTGEKLAIAPIQESKPLPASEIAGVAQRLMENVEKVIDLVKNEINLLIT